MKIVIIEDEPLTAEDLASTIREVSAGSQIIKTLQSVSESIRFFETGENPDIIFCDIQLGDGHSFEIFSAASVAAPVIFCTAYHEYAMEAFRNNGIDYILKPFTKQSVRQSIEKYHNLLGHRDISSSQVTHFLRKIQSDYSGRKKNTLLVHWKDRIIPVKVKEVAYVFIDMKMVYLTTFQGQTYYINHSLEEIEELCGPAFFRANRQYLINRESINEVRQYHTRKLSLLVKPAAKHDILISKINITAFMDWLKQ
ncbi:MAG: LytTR family DNA-binding domain-containing protein [Bacteroidetes bacterium]|nr:LytTR family DNA-binding domain-containing protein [Bacteroidota bacterium]